jgi:hypothetical protein
MADGGERRRAATGGGDAARDRARGLGFVRGLHRGVAREVAKSSRAARLARLRRGQRAARGGGGPTPASYPRRLEAWGRPKAAPGSSSPPCAAPGRLLNGGAATATKNSGDG